MRMISSRARVTTWEPASPSGSSSSRIAGGRRGRLLSTCRSRVFIAQRIVPDGRVHRPAPRGVRCGHAAGDLHRQPAPAGRLSVGGRAGRHSGRSARRGVRAQPDASRWTEVKAKPSSFGFAVAVHPRDPDTAWFVPAVKDELRVPVEGALVVTRTRNGGKSFETLRSGLPQRHAYHLIYRHGLEVAPDGQTLA